MSLGGKPQGRLSRCRDPHLARAKLTLKPSLKVASVTVGLVPTLTTKYSNSPFPGSVPCSPDPLVPYPSRAREAKTRLALPLEGKGVMQ